MALPVLFGEMARFAVKAGRAAAAQDSDNTDASVAAAAATGAATLKAGLAFFNALGQAAASPAELDREAAALEAALGAQVALADRLAANAARAGDVLDSELAAAAATVNDASLGLASLLERARAELSEKQLAVNENILGASVTLMAHIKGTSALLFYSSRALTFFILAELIRHASAVQHEIVASETGKGLSLAQFYKRHSRWVEGLVSAAKTVGAGAGSLVCVSKTVFVLPDCLINMVGPLLATRPVGCLRGTVSLRR